MTVMVAVGWLGNAFYFTRFLVQWIQSERARASVAPTVFWWLSLAGAASLGTYAYSVGDTPLCLGYVVTFVIYVRNASIAHFGPRAGRVRALPATAIALAAGATLIALAARRGLDDPVGPVWLGIAFVGQAIFSSRFVVQWHASERSGESHFPRSFWWLSLVGNSFLLAYAVRRGDPVFIAGFALGPIVQVRNLMLPGGDADAAASARSPRP